MIRSIVTFCVMLIAPLLLAGCQTRAASLPTGDAAYEVMSPGLADGRPLDYRIGPLDVLAVTVFREPDLTAKDLQVDAGGNLVFPLIGSVAAAGKSANELSAEIARRLDERYLRNPQVSVVITSSVSQRVVVEGNVNEPGVYEIGGNATLLEALARAKSPTRVAKLDEVVIFRVVDGKRMGAVFDVAQIRNGGAPDPRIVGGDTVVVGFSALKGVFRDILTTAPLLNVFRGF